ncbi:MAG: helix-turn-helix domain-containing protein [Frankiaceae bacterium]|nr:helix-turn-helix domain-containing protein [Frankiaceae bacterium]MBV9869197.1 helix-turn-helix domain-containing protein [Frankiaceae bacterium]
MQQPAAATVAATARRVERASGELATRALRRMEETLPWFSSLPPQPRSLVGLIVQAGIQGFADWLRAPGAGTRITADVFAVAPSDLASVVTLEQTVELVRIAVEITEDSVGELAAPSVQTWLREATLRYSREIAFAAALVYARAAEQRGSWDARLESLVVDAIVRGDVSDSLLSRAAALGWTQPAQVIVMAGAAPDGDPDRLLTHVRRLGSDLGADILAGVQTARLVVIVGVTGRLGRITKALLPVFAPGPVVTGPAVGGLVDAAGSVQDVFAALRAAPAWPASPRPVASEELLAERAIAGDGRAIRSLVADVYQPLAADPSLLATADAFITAGGVIEATARRLFVHANTVRYRLRRIAEVSGHDLTAGRDRYVIQVAVTLGRLEQGADRSERL